MAAAGGDPEVAITAMCSRLVSHAELVLPSRLYQDRAGPTTDQTQEYLHSLVKKDAASFLER